MLNEDTKVVLKERLTLWRMWKRSWVFKILCLLCVGLIVSLVVAIVYFSNLEPDYSAWEKALKDCQAQFDPLHQEISRFSRKFRLALEEIPDLREEIAICSKKNEGLTKEIEKLRSDNKDLQHELNETRKGLELCQKEKQTWELTTSIGGICCAVGIGLDIYEYIAYHSCAHELEEANKKITQLQGTITDLQKQVKEQQEQINTMRETINDMNNTINTITLETQTLNEHIIYLNTTNAELVIRVEEQQQEIYRLNEEVRELKHTVNVTMELKELFHKRVMKLVDGARNYHAANKLEWELETTVCYDSALATNYYPDDVILNCSGKGSTIIELETDVTTFGAFYSKSLPIYQNQPLLDPNAFVYIKENGTIGDINSPTGKNAFIFPADYFIGVGLTEIVVNVSDTTRTIANLQPNSTFNVGPDDIYYTRTTDVPIQRVKVYCVTFSSIQSSVSSSHS